MRFGYYYIRLLWYIDKWTFSAIIINLLIALVVSFSRHDLSVVIVCIALQQFLYLKEKTKGVLFYWLYKQEKEKKNER